MLAGIAVAFMLGLADVDGIVQQSIQVFLVDLVALWRPNC
jgi:hypothetical protein